MAFTNNYTLGRGKLYFQKEGESFFRYFGDTNAISMTQESENLDHFSSDEGVRVKDASVTLQNDLSGQFTTENIDANNLALFFQGSAGDDTVGAATGINEDFTDVQLGTYVQLGVTPSRPEGVGNITNIVVVNAGDTLASGVDYDLDATTGMLYIRDDSTDIDAGDDLDITYDTTAGTRSRVIDAGTEIRGCLRYVANNPRGTQRDKTWPKVKIAPSGDFQLKGDTWQALTFDFEVEKRDDDTPRIISSGRFA